MTSLIVVETQLKREAFYFAVASLFDIVVFMAIAVWCLASGYIWVAGVILCGAILYKLHGILVWLHSIAVILTMLAGPDVVTAQQVGEGHIYNAN